MRIALTATDNNSESMLDQRFGRAKYFIIFDTEKNEYSFVNNKQNLNAEQGAGIQSAQTVVQVDAEAVITGHTGPKAFNVLNMAGVKIYYSAALSVKDALQQFRNGVLKQATSSDVEGHWE